MKIETTINNIVYKSIDKPKMKHIRIGGKLMMIQEQLEHEPAKMYDYIEEIYGYIKDTFPKLGDGDIDNISTDGFMELVGKISTWANGGYAGGQKKT